MTTRESRDQLFTSPVIRALCDPETVEHQVMIWENNPISLGWHRAIEANNPDQRDEGLNWGKEA